MNETLARRFTGISCLAAAAAFIIEVPLYFVYSGPPPASNVLSRLLIGILALGFMLLFVTGFRELIKSVSPQHEWIGTLGFASGLSYVVITLVSSGLEAGAVIASDHPIDPTITVPGTYILYGSIGRMLLALFLASMGYAITHTNALPRWTGRTAYALALVNLAFLPSMFFGNKPAFFYSANGWGTTASMGAILSYWLLMLSIVILRSTRRGVHQTPGTAAPATQY